MSKGYVYILSNPRMPGLLKIGKTVRSVEGRANELFQTGVPAPFKVEHSVLSPDCDWLEAEMHRHFQAERTDPGREFFELEILSASNALCSLLFEQVSELVREFLPDQTLIEEDHYVDSSTVAHAAHKVGLGPEDMDCVFDSLTAAELELGVRRFAEHHQSFRKRVQKRDEKREQEGEGQAKVVQRPVGDV